MNNDKIPEYVTTKKATEILGVSSKTLYRWKKQNKIKFIQPGKRNYLFNVKNFFEEEIEEPKNNFIYARVSTRGQLKDLESQLTFLKNKYPGYKEIKDIGSGLNFKRKGLKTILEHANKRTLGEVVVAYKDRLCRFGFEAIQWIIESNGGRLVVLNRKETSPEEELVNDLIAIITVFSARIYGLRSYKSKIKEDTTLLLNETKENN
jgi:excisionase family DNA binding protein